MDLPLPCDIRVDIWQYTSVLIYYCQTTETFNLPFLPKVEIKYKHETEDKTLGTDRNFYIKTDAVIWYIFMFGDCYGKQIFKQIFPNRKALLSLLLWTLSFFWVYKCVCLLSFTLTLKVLLVLCQVPLGELLAAQWSLAAQFFVSSWECSIAS